MNFSQFLFFDLARLPRLIRRRYFGGDFEGSGIIFSRTSMYMLPFKRHKKLFTRTAKPAVAS